MLNRKRCCLRDLIPICKFRTVCYPTSREVFSHLSSIPGRADGYGYGKNYNLTQMVYGRIDVNGITRSLILDYYGLVPDRAGALSLSIPNGIVPLLGVRCCSSMTLSDLRDHFTRYIVTILFESLEQTSCVRSGGHSLTSAYNNL